MEVIDMNAKNDIKMIIKTLFLIFVFSILLITGPLYGQGFPEPERVCAGCGAAIDKGESHLSGCPYAPAQSDSAPIDVEDQLRDKKGKAPERERLLN